MKGIFRFTQSRPSEILPKSELNSFGLYVYSDEKKSEFLNDIRNLDTNNAMRYDIYTFFRDLIVLIPTIQELNLWAEKFIKPIKFKSKNHT